MTRNKKHRASFTTLEIATAVIIALLLLLANFKALLYSDTFYQKEFERQGSYERLGKDTVDTENSMILSYFKGGEMDDFFSEKERAHLTDVKSLVRNATYAYYSLIAALVLMMYLMFRKANANMKPLGRIFFYATAMLLSVFVLAYFASSTFSDVFYNFHRIAFNNDLWMLGSQDLLIQIYPEEFFYGFAREWMINSMISSMVIFVIGLFIYFNND